MAAPNSVKQRGLQAWEPHTAHTTLRNKAQEVFLQRFGWVFLIHQDLAEMFPS